MEVLISEPRTRLVTTFFTWQLVKESLTMSNSCWNNRWICCCLIVCVYVWLFQFFVFLELCIWIIIKRAPNIIMKTILFFCISLLTGEEIFSSYFQLHARFIMSEQTWPNIYFTQCYILLLVKLMAYFDKQRYKWFYV